MQGRSTFKPVFTKKAPPWGSKIDLEYSIGEAFLKLATPDPMAANSLINNPDDPPDLFFTLAGCSISIEVTEFVPYERAVVRDRAKLIRRLIHRLAYYEVSAPRPAQIFVTTDNYTLPDINERQLGNMVENIHSFLRAENFEHYSDRPRVISYNPIKLTYVPAGSGTGYIPKATNLIVRDSTRLPLNPHYNRQRMRTLAAKKQMRKSSADILLVFSTYIDQAGSIACVHEELSALGYDGVYYMTYSMGAPRAFVSLRTIKEHPIFIKDKNDRAERMRQNRILASPYTGTTLQRLGPLNIASA